MTETGSGTLYGWLTETLGNDATIVTSSRRLARELRAAFNCQQIARGRKAWNTPQIFSLNRWTASMIESSTSTSQPSPIDTNGSTILWERSVRKHYDAPLAGPRSFLRQARTAWQRLNEWNVPLSELFGEARSVDERAFARAAQTYNDTLGRNGWLDSAQVIAAVVELIHSGSVVVPRQIVYAGFDRITPQTERLFEAIKAGGGRVAPAPLRDAARTSTCSSHPNVDGELRAAGAWARARLREKPDARIAIVATGLESDSPRFERLVREGLAPGWQTADRRFRRSVNVSYGRRLSDYPAIHIALLCLQWCHRGLTSLQISALLRSPYVGGNELSGRSRLELYLRRFPVRRWRAAELVGALGSKPYGQNAEQWITVVRKLASSQASSAVKNTPVAWAGRIDEILSDIGWPGDGTLQSDEFQLINRWRELLNELATLEKYVPRMTYAEAVGHLENISRDTIYQPEAGHGLVNLLGGLEAAGMEFDYLWVTGLDANRWPAYGQPMALASRDLQRRHAMPDATPQDSLEYSRRVLGRLMTSADTVHLSWAHADQDAVQLPSPLLEELSVTGTETFGDPDWYARNLVGLAGVKSVPDDPVPPIEEQERISGGAYTVQRHKTDPFSAFAYGRLGIREIPAFENGLSPSMRGSLLHDVLFELLQSKPSQSDLFEWSIDESRRRIEAAIGKSIAGPTQHADGVIRKLFALEKIRLREVCREFLRTEMTRSPFSVRQVEERIEFEHADARLTLRADRIDRLSNDSLLIIDYKTGAVKNLVGRDGAPVDLQVVVYAAALEAEIGGLVLFNIGSRSIQYKGIAGSVEWNNKVADDWPGTLTEWRALVYRSMEAMAKGDVRINLDLSTEKCRPLNVLSRAQERKRGL